MYILYNLEYKTDDRHIVGLIVSLMYQLFKETLHSDGKLKVKSQYVSILVVSSNNLGSQGYI